MPNNRIKEFQKKKIDQSCGPSLIKCITFMYNYLDGNTVFRNIFWFEINSKTLDRMSIYHLAKKFQNTEVVILYILTCVTELMFYKFFQNC